MSRRRAFTLIELLVVIAVIAVLMSILMPALSRAREQGKRAVCQGNIKQLSLAWILYADANDDKIVNGCTVPDTGGHKQRTEPCWLKFSAGSSGEVALQGIRDGALYPYTENVKLYKCPTGVRGEANTYAITDAMNGAQHSGTVSRMILKKRSQIKRAGERIVFLDEGRTTTQSWTIYYNQEKFWDRIPMRHGLGTNMGFADGHGEYWKWEDPRTVKAARDTEITGWASANTADLAQGNADLYRLQNACWGELGYTPSKTK